MSLRPTHNPFGSVAHRYGIQYVPLSEEEKKARLDDLRQKLAEKRARKAQEDAKADKANEVSVFKFKRDTISPLILNSMIRDF